MKVAEIHKPDFFIVGAPKCGTTSLYYYLSQHKNIFLPPKERYFFGSDFTFLNGKPSLTHYQSFFKNAQQNQLVGEASVWYLFSKKAAEEIKTYNPNSKIIIMLRQPTDMIYSLHQHQLFNGNENITDFGVALKTQTEREKGNQIPKQLGCPIEGLQYEHVGKYYEQVKRYFNVFGKENVHIIWFDDFKNSVETEYEKVCAFLEILPLKNIDLTVKNKSQKALSKGLTKFLKYRSATAINLVKTLLPSRKLRYNLLDFFWKINSVEKQKKTLPKSLMQKLDHFFLEDIISLEKLIGKDLSNWKSRL